MFRLNPRRLVSRLFTAFKSGVRLPRLKPLNLKRLSLACGLVFLGYNITCIGDPDEHAKRIIGLRQLITSPVCRSDDIKQGQVYCFQREVQGRTQPIIIVRFKGKLYAVGGVCTYDCETPLKDSVVFGDKLYCPRHGCAFDVETGSVEYAPAIDNLPRFQVEEKDGRVTVTAPKYLPKKVQPEFMPRDYTDMRKVVIIGNGPSAFGCIEGLRYNGYTGEITLITVDHDYPYDKTKLTKSIKDLKYSELDLRPPEWYDMYGVTMLFGREVTDIRAKGVYPFVMLQDDTKIEYDGLLISTGSTYKIRTVQNLTNNPKSFYLRNKSDHQKIRQKLPQIHSLTILGASPKSLQFCSTIKSEYPHIKITIIDQNEKSKLENKFGKRLEDEMMDWLLKHGVESYNGLKISQVEDRGGSLEFRLEEGTTVSGEMAVLFPSNEVGNTRFIQNAKMEIDLDFSERVKVDFQCRTENKRIFAAGSCSAIDYYVTRHRMPVDEWSVSYHQGYTAAYNLLALRIPYHKIPYETFQSFDRSLTFVGNGDYYNEVYIVGDLAKWDFIALYATFDDIMAVAATPSQKNAAQIFAQAFRVGAMPKLDNFKDGSVNVEVLRENIKKKGKSGCYKDPIFAVKDDYIMKDVVWIHRDKDRFVKGKGDEGYLPGKVDEGGYFEAYKPEQPKKA